MHCKNNEAGKTEGLFFLVLLKPFPTSGWGAASPFRLRRGGAGPVFGLRRGAAGHIFGFAEELLARFVASGPDGPSYGVAGALPGQQQSTGLLHSDGSNPIIPPHRKRKDTPKGVFLFLAKLL